MKHNQIYEEDFLRFSYIVGSVDISSTGAASH